MDYWVSDKNQSLHLRRLFGSDKVSRCLSVWHKVLSQLSLICICLSALCSSLTVGAWNTASVVYRMWADDPLCLRSSSQRHPSHYVNDVLNGQFQYESVPNHKWMYRKMINPHFSMRVALGVRIMSSLWNRIDSLHRRLWCTLRDHR